LRQIAITKSANYTQNSITEDVLASRSFYSLFSLRCIHAPRDDKLPLWSSLQNM